MPRKTDQQLGMGRDITRRDFLQDSGLAALGLGLAGPALAGASTVVAGDYPPTRTGLRGSHPGAFETAHALAREGRSFAAPRDLDETWDLVVVGGGLSGLAAAWFYREQHGPDARILILENHDDFGGHAKRNEFRQAGAPRLGIGGTHNLEYPYFSDTVNRLMAGLGINIETLKTQTGFRYGSDGRAGPAVWFDADTFGEDRLVTGLSFRDGVVDDMAARLAECPLDPETQEAFTALFTRRTHVFDGLDDDAISQRLAAISYPDFLRQYGGLTEAGIQVMRGIWHGTWGTNLEVMSARECLEGGLPGMNLVGGEVQEFEFSYAMAMFPDGNASVARLLVQSLIPAVSPGACADTIATASFDYAELDRPDAPVQLRRSATVVNVDPGAAACAITYVQGGETRRVRARHSILACYHSIVPHLCPALPEAQKAALAYQVKHPLLLTNVLIRDRAPLEALGIHGAFCPGRLHTWLYEFDGVRSGGFDGNTAQDDATLLMFWGTTAAPFSDLSAREQNRVARARMLSLGFEDYEREVRQVLDGLLGPAGFDVKRDVLAITVNRWPHGYAYDYLDLWDPEWAPGEAPHEIARRPFGRITIANADAGANAYTHEAIDQAWRAVNELA